MSDQENSVMEEMDQTIVLTDENGEDVSFEFLDLIENDGKEYVVLLPAEQEDEENNEVLILQVVAEGEDESFLSVDDDATLDQVFSMFLRRMEEGLADGE